MESAKEGNITLLQAQLESTIGSCTGASIAIFIPSDDAAILFAALP